MKMNRAELIEFLNKNAEITFEALEETIQVRGNAIASGNEEEDKKVEDEIIARLNNGDISAWFCAHVKATFDKWEGDDFLGCCSYQNLSTDFLNDDGHYADMKKEAIENLADEIERASKTVELIEDSIAE